MWGHRARTHSFDNAQMCIATGISFLGRQAGNNTCVHAGIKSVQFHGSGSSKAAKREKREAEVWLLHTDNVT